MNTHAVYGAGATRLRQVQQWLDTRNSNRARLMPTWIRHENPTDTTAYERVPTPLLADLHPMLWLYGPYGDLYMRQVEAIHDQLDTMLTGEADDDFLIDFIQAYPGYGGIHLTDQNFKQLTAYAADHGLPMIRENLIHPGGYFDTDPRTRADLLLDHPLWDTHAQEKSGFERNLETFAYTTVQHDNLAHLNDPATNLLLHLHTRLCKRWGIPQ